MGKAVKVKLNSESIRQAVHAGAERQIQNIRNDVSNAYGYAGTNDWQIHIEGALGELAVAKYLDIEWAGTGVMRGHDVGEYDVRTQPKGRKDKKRSHLILHPRDEDDRIFWFVTGMNGTYYIRGWIRGEEGKKDEFWKEYVGGRPAYFVPIKALNDPREMKVAMEVT